MRSNIPSASWHPTRLLAMLGMCLLAASSSNAQSLGHGPLPPPSPPPENPVTPEKAILGKALFWDEQLSSDNTVACGTCHRPQSGFSDPREARHPGPDMVLQTPDDFFTSPGIIRSDANHLYQPDAVFGLEVQKTGRRAPDIFGAIYAPEAFWDGRATSEFRDPKTGAVIIPLGGALESQVIGPPVSTAEMAHEARDWDDITAKLVTAKPLALASDLTPDLQAALLAHPDYPALFQQAFGTPDITAVRVAFAIASYERTLIPERTPYFRWLAGQTQAMTPDQVEGHDQFFNLANCATCHQPPVFTVHEYSNIGLRPWQDDPGRMDISGLNSDRGKFKIPSLLNAGLRPRFFHTGEENTLWPGGVGQVYMDGGGPNLDNRDPLLLDLNQVPGVDMAKIMDFVGNALTDPRVRDGLPPFDRPTLRSERLEQAGGNLYGFGTAAQPGSTAPRILAAEPAFPGANLFRIGVEGGTAGAQARLLLGQTRLAGQLHRGVAMFVRPYPNRIVAITLEDDGQGGGYGTALLPIPNSPSLIGTQVFAQWFVDDPSAAQGTVTSEAAVLRIEG